jgi:hypothetical protein
MSDKCSGRYLHFPFHLTLLVSITMGLSEVLSLLFGGWVLLKGTLPLVQEICLEDCYISPI